MVYFPKASCSKNARLILGTFSALTLCTIAVPGFAQSADPKKPAPLQPGDNIAVIHSIVQIPQYYSVTIGPGKGTLTIEFSSNGFPGTGGQIRLTLLRDKKKNYSVGVTSTQAVFSSGSAQTGQVIIPFDIKQATKVILRIDPPSSALLVAAGRYNLQATGAVKFAETDPNPAQVVGTYRIRGGNIFGEGEEGKLIKLFPDGRIESETGAIGSWSLFDASTKTYVLQLPGKRSTLIFWPAVGFSKESAGNPDIILVR